MFFFKPTACRCGSRGGGATVGSAWSLAPLPGRTWSETPRLQSPRELVIRWASLKNEARAGGLLVAGVVV